MLQPHNLGIVCSEVSSIGIDSSHIIAFLDIVVKLLWKYVKFSASRFLLRSQDMISPSPYPSPTRGEGTSR